MTPNSSACNAIHKCADLRTDISRFAEPAPTWITLLHTCTGTLGCWSLCVHTTKRPLFFWGGVTPSLLNIKGLYPILWLSQKSKTNENIPASHPSSREEKVRSSVTETGMKGGKEGGGHLNTGLNTAVKKKGRPRRKEVSERRVDLTGRLFLRPELSVCVYSAS